MQVAMIYASFMFNSDLLTLLKTDYNLNFITNECTEEDHEKRFVKFKFRSLVMNLNVTIIFCSLLRDFTHQMS